MQKPKGYPVAGLGPAQEPLYGVLRAEHGIVSQYILLCPMQVEGTVVRWSGTVFGVRSTEYRIRIADSG